MLDALHFSPDKQPHSLSGLRDAYQTFLGEQSEPESDVAAQNHFRGMDYVLGILIEFCNKRILQQPLIQRAALLQEYRTFLPELLFSWQNNRWQDDYDRGRIETMTLVIEHLKEVNDFH